MKKAKILKRVILLSAVILITILIGSIIIKYQVEGETNMPFQISKIMVISNAQGAQVEDATNQWNLNLIQNNDIYINIVKNKNYHKTEIIDKVIIDNLKIEEQPIKGQIKTYRANEKENGIYVNSQEYLVQDNLTYTGSENSDMQNLQIANQGGLILLRYVNENLGSYVSNEAEEIRHDGTLLGKIGLKDSDLQFKVSFDLSIVLKSDITYQAKIELKMPVGNIIEEGTASYEKTDVRDIVFKRI